MLPRLLQPDALAVVTPLLNGAPPGPVAFDADGTLWRGDVGEDLLRWLVVEDRLPRHRGDATVYAQYERRVERDPADGYAFAVAVMADLEESALVGLCRDFFERRFHGRLFPFTRPLLEALAARGHTAWIVSASPRWIVEAGASRLGIPAERVIGVDCELEGGRLTDRVKRPVPCGAGKVELLTARGVRPLLGVGNGELDQPMLEYSGAALVIAPHQDPGNSLVRAAVQRRWPVQRG